MANKSFSLEVREQALKISHGFCQCHQDCLLTATEFHHMMSNTKPNQKKFPLFINSIFNCCPINNACHKSPPRIGESQAIAYEWYLKNLLASPSELH